MSKKIKEIKKKEVSNKVTIARPIIGICHMQVCAEKGATDEEILDVCNSKNPSGTEFGWAKVIRIGESAPIVCDSDPNRLHILIAC